MHFKYYDEDDVHNEYSPTNTYLLDSLLSGLSPKFELTAATDSYAAILDGLDARRGGYGSGFLSGHTITTPSAGPYRKSGREGSACDSSIGCMQFISHHRDWVNLSCSSQFCMLKAASCQSSTTTVTNYGHFSSWSRDIRFKPLYLHSPFSPLHHL